ncbi:unnamed protein product [Paramecium sonneborni]|uniref:Transmembrane protein n=1 Tax=Paramecium sonneborni TaxID=65129 RepID=A0A8S1LAG3_9CILI|nr:unnamed protein product [Paramecium sonneborni]
MNKFRLNFQDQQLEKKFQKEKLESIQFPLTQSLCFGGIIIIIITLVNQYQTKVYHNLYQVFSLLIAFILGLLISRIKKKHSIKFLIFIYFAIILQELNSEPDFDTYDGFLKGCNFMIVHAIIGFGLDFVPSTLVNILYTIIRILINYFNSGQLLPVQYTLTIATSIAYSYLIYKIEYLHRSAFLFKFKDDNWESLIPKLITKPFAILRFRKEILQFQLISSNKTYGYFVNEEMTKQFINQSSVRQTNNSLLLYLYKIHEEYSTTSEIKDTQFSLDLIFEEKKIKLHLILNKFEELNFIMILESEDVIIKNQKLQYNICLKHLKNNHLKQLTISQHVLKKFLKSKNTSLIIQYRLSLFQYQILKCQKLLFNDAVINLSQFYTRVLNQLQQYYKISFLIEDNMAQITSKQLHLLFIFELIKNANPQSNISIKMHTNQEKIMFIVSGLNQFQKSQFSFFYIQLMSYFFFQ